MKNFIQKNSIAAVAFAAFLSLSSAASASELSLPVSIEQVGKLKFLVSPELKTQLIVTIYDTDNNLIHSEAITSKKMFSFADLVDGAYRMEILDARKNLLKSKTFSIKTEVKRDLVAIQ
jgi:hypothetical protein